MEIIGRVSKGSKMDQIYLPKNRAGFAIGNYVVIKPFWDMEGKAKQARKPYFYGIKDLEPLKLEIINEILNIIDRFFNRYENIFITGSFLDRGFQFNDVDVVILTDDGLNPDEIRKDIERKTGIIGHILVLSNREFIRGLEIDPLYQMMLSRCVSKKRFVYKIKHKINYKILDLHLLKSKTLISSFDVLSGNEKYDPVRNMIAIHLYLAHKKVSRKSVDNEIKRVFDLKDTNELKKNFVDKKSFLKKYKLIYDKISSIIMEGIENGAKQKQTN